MMWLLKGLLVIVVTSLVAAQFVGPARTNPPVVASATLHAKSPIPQDVHAILSRACWNCHSSETQWPWYSHVAPISWSVIGHVNHGREHVNFNDWQFSPEEGVEVLDEVCEQVKRGDMPIPAYTWLHPEAKLSPADVTRLCEWAGRAADALMASH